MTIVDEYSKRYPPSASSKRCEPALLLPLSTIEFYLRIIKALGDPIPAAIKYSESCKKKKTSGKTGLMMSVEEQSLQLSKERFKHFSQNHIQEINLFIFPSMEGPSWMLTTAEKI